MLVFSMVSDVFGVAALGEVMDGRKVGEGDFEGFVPMAFEGAVVEGDVVGLGGGMPEFEGEFPIANALVASMIVLRSIILQNFELFAEYFQ